VAGDHLGGPVALSGTTALIGAWNRHQGTGAAYVFVLHAQHWVPQAELHAPAASPATGSASPWRSAATPLWWEHRSPTGAGLPMCSPARPGAGPTRLASPPRDGHLGDWFGRAVALEGYTALVGAWSAHQTAGAAYVFTRTGTTWRQQAALLGQDEQVADYVGTSVALREGLAVVGAAGWHGNQGAVYVFVRHGIRWRQQALLSAGDGQPGDLFGGSVVLGSGLVVVGAGFAHHQTGAAYVFVQRGGVWGEQAALTAQEGQAGDWFGVRVALSGQTVLVGAWYALPDSTDWCLLDMLVPCNNR
jgi:hypothetical protein